MGDIYVKPFNGLVIFMATSIDLATLTPRHFKIVDLALKGWRPVDIAEHLSMSPRQVSTVMNSPTFSHELAIRRSVYEDQTAEETASAEDEVTRVLKEGAVKAADKLVKHIDSIDDSISVKSCAEVLDRSGYGKKRDMTNINVGSTVIINSEDARRIAESIDLDKECEQAKSNEATTSSLSPSTETQTLLTTEQKESADESETKPLSSGIEGGPSRPGHES